jgi:hypothetical protein
MTHIALLSLLIRPLRVLKIGAAVHDIGDTVAKPAADIVQPHPATLVFRRVMQECGYNHVFVCPALENQRRHAK